MSNVRYQIRSSVNLTAAESSITDSYAATNLTVAQASEGVFRNTQAVGITEEQIDVGSIVTPGLSFFENLDDTNYVEIGFFSSGTGIPSNSQLQVDVNGIVWMQSATNSLWYQVQMQGTNGSAAINVGQTGTTPTLPLGTFYPLVKIKAGEAVFFRIGVSAAQLYAKANTAEVKLLCIIYED